MYSILMQFVKVDCNFFLLGDDNDNWFLIFCLSVSPICSFDFLLKNGF